MIPLREASRYCRRPAAERRPADHAPAKPAKVAFPWHRSRANGRRRSTPTGCRPLGGPPGAPTAERHLAAVGELGSEAPQTAGGVGDVSRLAQHGQRARDRLRNGGFGERRQMRTRFRFNAKQIYLPTCRRPKRLPCRRRAGDASRLSSRLQPRLERLGQRLAVFVGIRIDASQYTCRSGSALTVRGRRPPGHKPALPGIFSQYIKGVCRRDRRRRSDRCRCRC